MAGKFYAVRKGTVTGIFRTWEECKKNVHGYSGAEYKSFKTLEEAEAYMKGGAVTEEVTDTVPIYVDGSYNKVTKEFSYGMVVLLKEGEQTFCKSYRDEELATMHNVAGEIKGAEAAMRYAMENHIPAITRALQSGVLGTGRPIKKVRKPIKHFMRKPQRRFPSAFRR